MNCDVCKHDKEKRKEWGCDEELAVVPPWLVFECFLCTEDYPQKECPICKGSGQWEQRRCPRLSVGLNESRICQQAALFADLGIMPATGGYMEQAAQWDIAVSFVLGERHAYKEQARKIRESKGRTGAA